MRIVYNLISLLVGICSLSSCMMLLSKTTPKADKFPIYSKSDTAGPSLYIHVDYMKYDEKRMDAPKLSKANTRSYSRMYRSMAENSNLFSSVSKDGKDSLSKDYNMQIVFQRNLDINDQIVKGILSGATFLLFPVRMKESYNVEVNLYDNEGGLAYSNEYTDTLSHIFQLFLLPISPAYLVVPSLHLTRVTRRVFYDLYERNIIRRENE